MPMIGDKKTAKELRTLINVAARLTSCHGCTIRTAENIDIIREQTGEINASCHRISTHVLEHGRQGKAKREEEDARAAGRRTLAIVHHHQQKVWWVPVNLTVDFLRGTSSHETTEAD